MKLDIPLNRLAHHRRRQRNKAKKLTNRDWLVLNSQVR
jgi:hypothetical protein